MEMLTFPPQTKGRNIFKEALQLQTQSLQLKLKASELQREASDLG